MKQLLVYLQSERIYERIVGSTDTKYLSGHLNDIKALRAWLAKNQPAAALIDAGAPEDVHHLIGRFNVPITIFDGGFPKAEAWIAENLRNCGEQPTDENIEKPKDSATNSPKTKPSIPQRKSKDQGRMQALIPNGVPEPKPQPQPEPIIQIIEKEIIKEVIVPQIVTQALRPRLIVVVSIWPRAGATFVSMTLSDLIARNVSYEGAVTLIEHPDQTSSLFHVLNLADKESDYIHWLQDGKGTPIDHHGIKLVPRVTKGEDELSQEELIKYIYRTMHLPFVLIDAGTHTEADMLLDLADDVFLVMDCDPQYLSSEAHMKRYFKLAEMPNAKTVLNKWTRQANVLRDLPGAIPIPYLSPDRMQFASWEGVMPSSLPEIREQLEVLEKKIVLPWIPSSLKTDSTGPRTWPWSRRRTTK